MTTNPNSPFFWRFEVNVETFPWGFRVLCDQWCFSMESEETQESVQVLQHKFTELEPVQPEKARFPCCIVWTPLPILSWFIPFIGHIGICREDGVILDFAGPNFVCVDNFTFGSPRRYIQINREKVGWWLIYIITSYHLVCIFHYTNQPLQCDILDAFDYGRDRTGTTAATMTWDEALKESTQEFQHRAYNLFTCNCHSFVANCMNRMGYSGRSDWNVVNLAAFIFIKGVWIRRSSFIRTFTPVLIVLGLGFMFGKLTFLASLAAFYVAMVGWFIVGTYCFKDLIRL